LRWFIWFFCTSIGFFVDTRTLSVDFFIGLAILLLLHSFATVQNDIADFEIDKANKRKSVLQDSKLSLYNARLIVQALAFVALVFALLSPHKKLHLLVILGLFAVSWLYNLNPVRISKKPIASIVLMGLCYGAFPFAYGYLLAGGNLMQGYFLVLALFWLLARIATAVMKDYKDAIGDALFNKKTFYLRYGREATGWTSIIASAVAYIGLMVVLVERNGNNALFFLALAAAVLLALRSVLLRLKLVKTKSEKQLNVIFQRSVLSHNQFEGAVLVCLILSSR
jgi:4-hydroxybenzoate polyprenyltransferase